MNRVNNQLTRRQFATVNFISVFAEKNRYCPTIKELSMQFGISVYAVQTRLIQLRKKGWIDWVEGQSRTVHVTEGGESALNSPIDIKDYDRVE